MTRTLPIETSYVAPEEFKASYKREMATMGCNVPMQVWAAGVCWGLASMGELCLGVCMLALEKVPSPEQYDTARCRRLG